jgi:hypothetical protein
MVPVWPIWNWSDGLPWRDLGVTQSVECNLLLAESIQVKNPETGLGQGIAE